MSALSSFLSDYDSYYDLYVAETNKNRRQAEDREQELRKMHGLMDLFTLSGNSGDFVSALTYYQSMLTLLEVPLTNSEWLVVDADLRQYFGAGLFRQISNSTVANTTVETSAFSNVDGSQTLPANFMEANGMWRLSGYGFISGVNNNTATIRIKVGSVTLITSTLTMPATFTNSEFLVEFFLSCRTDGATGTVIGQGNTIISAGVGQATSYFRSLLMTTTAVVNTTISNKIDVTYQWGTASASNSMTLTHATFYPVK